ncbi:MAG: hypothetical protein IKM29_06045 [Clostridia bacterium]|nr:hypothetical protein [Clostridia bacterium]
MKNECKMTYYPLTPIQKTYMILYAVCFRHTQAANIPISVYFDGEIDVDLMRRALVTEVERNDCLRAKMAIRFFGVKQCYLPEKDIGEIPFDDFIQKTEEEFAAYVKEQSFRRLAVFKGVTFRIRIFRAPNGRFGLHGSFSHIFQDAYAVGLFYRDLISVYSALKNGTPLPPALDRFEDTLQHDLALYKNKAHMKRVVGFFDKYFKTPKSSLYCGVDRMRDLNRVRKRWHAPSFRGVPIFHPFRDRAEVVTCSVERELKEKMKAFCAENRVSMQALFQMGLRTHLSKVNENAGDVTLLLAVARRCTKADLNSGGTRALAHMMRTDFTPDMTFAQGLKATDRCNLSLYKHADYQFLREFFKQGRYDKRIPWFTAMSTALTFFPFEMLDADVGMKYEYFSMGTGFMHVTNYTMIAPNFISGGYDCFYVHQTNVITEEDVWLLHGNMIKVIKAGIERPEITIGELLSDVL